MFCKENDIIYAGVGVAAGSAIDANSTRIDMLGYESITFIAPILDSVATGVARLKIEGNSADSDTGMAVLEAADGTDAEAVATCVTNDDLNGKNLVVTVHKPRSRWVQGVRVSSVANIQFGDIIAIRSRAKKLPVPAGSTIAAAVGVVAG